MKKYGLLGLFAFILLPALYFYRSDNLNKGEPMAGAAAASIPAGFVEYKNDKYNFSLDYPANTKPKEYDEGNGGTTITIENDDTLEGFQIFVAPYTGGNYIPDDVFKRDEPSGVRKDVTQTKVDGEPALSFHGYDKDLGVTSEAWFVHGGYIYEVSTIRKLENWLSPIMNSWRFTK